jgi:hypothetical protein
MKSPARLVGILLAVSASLVGCTNKDAAKCTQAVATTRQALGVKDMASATKWREYAYKQCADVTELGNLDKEIIAKQNEIAQAAQAKAKAEAQQKQLLSLVKEWVSQSKAAPERSVSKPICELENDKAVVASKERFCSGTRAVTGVEGMAFQVKYWEKTPAEAALFSVRLPLPVTCADLGEFRTIKEITLPSTDGRTVKRTHCEITGGPLSGLEALATQGANSELWIFSAKYREQDPALRMLVK